MSWLTNTIAAGISAFVATNLDDVVILMLFFAQTNSTFRPKHIVVGQYLGFSVLLLASLPGFLGGLIVPKSWIGLLGLVPIVIGLHQLIHLKSEDNQTQMITSPSSDSKASTLAEFLAPQSYQVAAVTIANGGDNIGIYLPLFARSDLVSLSVILSVFLMMVGMWCYIANQLVRHPIVARVFMRYGSAIVPFVLIGLGVFILIDSDTYRLFVSD
ncbi:MAG: cadmium resistance transporter [Phormidesmis sp. CAN_BIN36]|nr:cadmium resistance transporter [Phormidesmis sp. CAN_BIN36]